MTQPIDDAIDPELALMLAYVPTPARPRLDVLWRLDTRFARIVAAAREPGLGAIRLAWWREALEHLDKAPAPAEPLLRDVAAHLLPAGLSGAELGRFADGWSVMLGERPEAAELATHAGERGGGLFTLAARLLGEAHPTIGAAGEGWALVDLVRRGADVDAATALRLAAERLAPLAGVRWPRPLRPLAALAALARDDARRGAARPAGSPRRVARFAIAALTGR